MRNERWSWRPLGELFDIGAGKTMSVRAREGAGQVPFLRTSNVLWDEIGLRSVDNMALSETELREKVLEKGDLLVCEGGDIGRSAVWTGEIHPMSFQNHIHRLRPLVDDVDPHFYVYFLQSAFTQLGMFEGAGNKTTIPNLSRNRLAALEVPQPPRTEQASIATALAHVRRAIKINEKLIEASVSLRVVTMRQLFACGLRGETQTDTRVGQKPQSWRVGPIREFCELQRGFDITKASQSTGKVPVISSGGVRSFHNEHRAVGPGVVIGRKGSIGTIYYIAEDYWPHDTTLWVTDFKDNLPKFVYYRLSVLGFSHLDSGAANPALNRNLLHEEFITWPDRAEQEQIIEVIEAVDRKIQIQKKKQIALAELFKSLLHKLMTGEIDVTALDLSALDVAKPIEVLA